MDERLETTVCYRHPERATRLRCSECNRPICVECSHDAAVGQKCPECAKPQGRYRVVQARNTVGRRGGFDATPVTYTIMAISIAIFAIGFVSPAANRWFLEHFASINVLIAQGEWWRVLTAAFLHGGITHILFNMYALYLFGPRLETQVGSAPFALLYFASAAGGGAASYLFGPLNQIAVGASGAIFGLFGAWLYVAYKLRETPAGRSMFNQLGVLLLINLALPLLIPNIDWRAHVGGLLTGVAIAALWGQFAVGRRDVLRRRSVLAVAVLVGLILLIVFA
jgi:membrane associated rhomboid family serine protease